jgi:uncharacterized protein
MSTSYDHADKLESAVAENEEQSPLARLRTKGGHPDDRSQPALPIVHRSFANPAPLGLLSFATGELTTIQGLLRKKTKQGLKAFS